MIRFQIAFIKELTVLRDCYITVVTEIDVIILTSSCYYEN